MSSWRAPVSLLAIEAVVLTGIAAHAFRKRAERQLAVPAITAVSRLLPGADLSVSGGTRQLRFPSIEEPGAAFSDAPASADIDPAGAALAPPIDVYTSIAVTSGRAPGARPGLQTNRK